jgi:2-polyprenyl-3-methyl-5-hydroxy-6-metoxy-1,4-benzoquinol methylase
MNITKEIEMQHLAAQNKMSLLYNYYLWPLNFLNNIAKKNIWESSAGIGILAEKLVNISNKMIITEYTSENIHILSDKFKAIPNIHIEQCDLSNFDTSRFANMDIDIIINLDVLEHIEDDLKVLQDFCKVLKPGGKLLIKTPAHPFLYCSIDKQSLHYRRYSKKVLRKQLINAGFEVEKMRYINMAGAIAYFIKGKIQKKETNFSNTFSTTKLQRINKLIPLMIKVEKIVPAIFGLSVVAVATKR